jgi:menaquinone-dependent protoporphyrinogen oxidase
MYEDRMGALVMKLLVGYATKEGQSRKIARYLADRAADKGYGVELLSLQDTEDIQVTRFDEVLLIAPVHAGHYPKTLGEFVSAQADSLKGKPTRFISVSLAAAGHDAEDWRNLDKIVDDFANATGWQPTEVKHVAGAYKPSQYDILTRFIMRRIITAKDPEADLGIDKDYTDWSALEAWLDKVLVA